MQIPNFPQSQWVMGRFLGIAWDSGDLFTFKVWSEPDGKWQKGGEFVRNVVRPLNAEEMPISLEADKDLKELDFQCQFRTNKCKCSQYYVYERRSVPDVSDFDDDVASNVNNGDNIVEDGVNDGTLIPTDPKEKEPEDSGGESPKQLRLHHHHKITQPLQKFQPFPNPPHPVL